MRGFVTGIGKTRFGSSARSLASLAQEALMAAIDDAGVDLEQVDAIVVANFLGGPNDGQLHLNSVVGSLLPGLHPASWRTEAACASGGVAVHQGLLGLTEYGVVVVVGVERLSGIVGTVLTRNIAMAGDALVDVPSGLSFPATYALVAQRHFAEYGTTTADLDIVALKNHANARLNPKAHFYHKTVIPTDVTDALPVASPLRLFDCCPISDGAAAVVLESRPRDARSVAVLGSAVSTDAISLAQRPLQTAFPAARIAGERAYASAGIGPADIDVAEVHDCFTIAEIIAMEDLGFAVPGEAAARLRSHDTHLGGALPINTSGGLKAGGHAIGATGVSQVCEIVIQLRGEAGLRQVEGARIGLTHNVGGVGGTCAVHILGSAS